MLGIYFANRTLFTHRGEIFKLGSKVGLPIWITSAVKFSALKVDENRTLYFIEPKAALEFDQLVKHLGCVAGVFLGKSFH